MKEVLREEAWVSTKLRGFIYTGVDAGNKKAPASLGNKGF
jgi:hypothetical protein